MSESSEAKARPSRAGVRMSMAARSPVQCPAGSRVIAARPAGRLARVPGIGSGRFHARPAFAAAASQPARSESLRLRTELEHLPRAKVGHRLKALLQISERAAGFARLNDSL